MPKSKKITSKFTPEYVILRFSFFIFRKKFKKVAENPKVSALKVQASFTLSFPTHFAIMLSCSFVHL